MQLIFEIPDDLALQAVVADTSPLDLIPLMLDSDLSHTPYESNLERKYPQPPLNG